MGVRGGIGGGGGGHFKNNGWLRKRNTVLRPPHSREVPPLIIPLLITKWMLDMVRMHFWDNQKLGKCSIYIYYEFHIYGIHLLGGWGIFRAGDTWERNTPFWGCLHFQDVPPWIEYFLFYFFFTKWMLDAFKMLVCKIEPWFFLVICNIIYINGIHMLGWGDIFKTGDVWERSIPFWGCPHSNDVPLSIVQLLFYYHMQILHVWMYSSNNQEL